MKRLLLVAGLAVALRAQTHWVGTWGAAPAPQGDNAPKFSDQTLREIVHVSLGGDTIRVRLSNAFGPAEAEIGAAHVALRTTDSAIAAGSDRVMTFSGRPAVSIPPGAVVLSDPIQLPVGNGADLAVSLYIPGTATAAGVHGIASQTSWIAKGDMTGAASLTDAAKAQSWAFVTGVDVAAPASAGTIVAFGDSITDGARSTPDMNHRWPDILAARLQARKGGPRCGVVNMGIGGNRVLNDGSVGKAPRSGLSALARFDEDVLAQSGVKYVIVLEGINDIGHIGPKSLPQENVTAEDIIAGHRQLIARAHEAGIKAIGATVTPFEGEQQSARGYYTPEKEKIRAALNEFIRNGHAYDGVVDFDRAVRDPKSPNVMLKAFDSGDSLHPNDAGYKAMGDAFDLAVFDDNAPAASNGHWVATWAASPSLPQDAAQMKTRHLEFDNQTVRLIAHVSLGGDRVRVRVSNAFGTAPLRVGEAHVGLSAGEASVVAGSDRTLTFGGSGSIAIPAGAIVLSDAVELKTPSLSNLAVSLYLPESAAASAVHYGAQQRSYVGAGNATGAATMADAVAITSWVYLAGIDVAAPASARTIVAFGDSITDGARSTVDANRRWPDVLAGRLAGKLAVVDAGIGGNRILHDAARNVTYGPSALARFDRDVLAQPGVGYVVILEGINDLGHPGGVAPISETVTAADMIAGLRQMVDRAHEKGVKAIGATITPSSGSGEKEEKRLAVNEWIRNGKAFDGVVDFEKAIRDPEKPGSIAAPFDGGDHLHPGDAGYKAMGEAIELRLFR
jgi:lysophospholipase L1-like esterase